MRTDLSQMSYLKYIPIMANMVWKGMNAEYFYDLKKHISLYLVCLLRGLLTSLYISNCPCGGSLKVYIISTWKECFNSFGNKGLISYQFDSGQNSPRRKKLFLEKLRKLQRACLHVALQDRLSQGQSKDTWCCTEHPLRDQELTQFKYVPRSMLKTKCQGKISLQL